MPSDLIEVLKLLGGFFGAIIGAVGALSLKEWLEKKEAIQRTGISDALATSSSARLLKQRLEDLTDFYLKPSHPWKDYRWKSPAGPELPLPSLSRDFHEIYLIQADPPAAR